MARQPNLPLALALAALAMVALTVNAYRWTTAQSVSLPLAGLAVTLLLMLAILPWMVSRPAIDPTLPQCHKCGAPFVSTHPASFCLMCGAFPRARTHR